jgi:serine/threonine-protein kinase
VKESFWKTDWFTGVTLAVVILVLAKFSFLQNFDHLIYDTGMNFGSRNAGSQLTVIAIDDRSTETLGRWPWSRNLLAELVGFLHDSDAKVIVLTDRLTEEQSDPGLQHLQQIQQVIASTRAENHDNNPPLKNELDQINKLLTQSAKALDADNNLAQAIDLAGNVLVRMDASPSKQNGIALPAGHKFPNKNTLLLANVRNGEGSVSPQRISRLQSPIEKIDTAAIGAGHLSYPLDADSRVRRHPLIINYKDDHYPSLALQIVAQSLGVKTKDIRPITNNGINIGNFFIPTDKQLQTSPYFYRGKQHRTDFPINAAIDVLSGNLPAQNYKDKIVLIGTTEKNADNLYRTPLNQEMPDVMLLAHTTASLLNSDGIKAPFWNFLLTLTAFLAVLFYLIRYLNTLTLKKAYIYSSVFFILLLGIEFLLIALFSIWIPLLWPAVLLLLGHFAILFKQPEKVSATTTDVTSQDITADNNYTLGKTFLQQGQLDWAFDKFRRCATSEALMNKLGRLAASYEADKQFVKAHNVYKLMATHDKKYPGLEHMLQFTHQRIGDNASFNSHDSRDSGGADMAEAGHENLTMLGRYQLERELGKGSMGRVYLGRDTRINRIVAIKTLYLGTDFDESETDTVKTRFFREAEMAGKLNHTNIVTIYDAGEENNLGYIAMEYLPGHDLTRYTTPDKLLPPQAVLGMLYKAAKALDYAHSKKVIHRDIKPANIMIEPAAKKVILTDFGIARIVDVSSTRTGIVLGTPSYMSPEQLAGSKIDGRSDLFALGAMLFQLLTGELPFTGDSLSMLMYMITNEPHRDILTIKPELAKSYPDLADVIAVALAKDVDQRFQTGAEMANALKLCAHK